MRFFRRSKKNRRRLTKIKRDIKRAVVLKKRYRPSEAPTLKAIARLERLPLVKKSPILYVNRNLEKTSNPRDNFKNAFRAVTSQKNLCERRRDLRNAIMARTKGKGLSIKKARWTASSYIQCKG